MFDSHLLVWVAVIGVCGSVAVAAINKFPIGGPSPDPKSADTTGPTETIEIKVPPGPISPPTSLVWFVQLGYFESLANAEQTKADLEGKGIKDIKILDASHLPIWACRKGGNFLVIGPATQDVARKMQLEASKFVEKVFSYNGYQSPKQRCNSTDVGLFPH